MDITQIVRSYVGAWQARDLDGYLATFAPDGTYSDPLLPQPTRAHNLREHLAGYFTGFPDVTCETVALDAISDQLCVWRFIIRGTNTGSFRDIPPTGRKVAQPACEFIEVRDGGINSVVGYMDVLTTLTQLGVAPSWAPGRPT
jgi:steroid delta-isomerase-like uncharacterized protein